MQGQLGGVNSADADEDNDVSIEELEREAQKIDGTHNATPVEQKEPIVEEPQQKNTEIAGEEEEDDTWNSEDEVAGQLEQILLDLRVYDVPQFDQSTCMQSFCFLLLACC